MPLAGLGALLALGRDEQLDGREHIGGKKGGWCGAPDGGGPPGIARVRAFDGRPNRHACVDVILDFWRHLGIEHQRLGNRGLHSPVAGGIEGDFEFLAARSGGASVAMGLAVVAGDVSWIDSSLFYNFDRNLISRPSWVGQCNLVPVPSGQVRIGARYGVYRGGARAAIHAQGALDVGIDRAVAPAGVGGLKLLGANGETSVQQDKLETVVAGLALWIGQWHAVNIVAQGSRAETVGLVVE